MNQTFIDRHAQNCRLCGWLAGLLFMAFVAGCGSANVAEPIEDASIAAKDSITAEEPAAADAATAEPAHAVTTAADTAPTTAPVAKESLSRTDALLAAITIFMLAIFVGFELITKVPPTLHTPLMSGSNAISGITLVGALLMAGNNQSGWAAFFGMLAVAMATVNVVGGFMVTDRMLSMFRGK